MMTGKRSQKKNTTRHDTRCRHSFGGRYETHLFLFAGAEIFVLLGTFAIRSASSLVGKFIIIKPKPFGLRVVPSVWGPASNCRYITHLNYIMFAFLFIFFHVKLLIQLYANIYVFCLSFRCVAWDSWRMTLAKAERYANIYSDLDTRTLDEPFLPLSWKTFRSGQW